MPINNMKPTLNNILIKKVEEEGIFHSSEGIFKGVVIATGDGILKDGNFEKVKVKENDVVIFTNYRDKMVYLDKGIYHIVSEDEILIIL
jgi:co-chaperonin GroES (HSP10)